MIGLAVALDGHGWHPQAWRVALTHRPDAAPVTSGRHWTPLVQTAERGLLDFVSFEDTLSPQAGRKPQLSPRRLAGRADAVMVAAHVAPATRHIGLVPIATVTHTEPFHVSKAIATLDFVSRGRGGWQPRVSAAPHEAALFGRRDVTAVDLFDEAADVVEVVRRLWDSWEDDAVIRDVATGRYVDRTKLHYVDFEGRYFSVKGPSITPRPPQGQPVVAVLAHSLPVYRFAAAAADLVFITPTDDATVASLRREVSDAGGDHLQVWADIVVSLHGEVPAGDFRSDALIFTGDADELVALLLRWQRLGVDGVRLRPAVNDLDLPAIVDDVVPRLQDAGAFRTAYRDGETLRQRLGLAAAINRYTREGR
ncbi:LLM class flavin-dependent oxidoreductase [Mycobacterium sp. MYCO198283]|uniref:LLM class flavin-dependent oxidoreductase n=1 Tax=Mycobacterium sp. MYCO198283 TaxID=2883505 RepID=UPI001E468CA0|nr:LLM class flavin-dependent oxidoreductase [Mycobacterium sp. MYCO198283]MCG5432177.1 LLM class flavin-dependent oxidoreductase [Mycobacterium sp. MYCO198283]